MRGTKAKAMRKENPERPNPGRKHGGAKGTDRTNLPSLRRQRKFFKKSGKTDG